MNDGLERRLFWALLVFSAIVRLVFFLQLRGTDFGMVPLLDAETYHEWALRLVGGDPGWNETYWMGPLYPHFLAVVYLAFGVGSEPVFLIQLALSLLNVWLVRDLARALLKDHPHAGIIALVSAALFALYGPSVFYAGTLLMAVVTTTLFLVTVRRVLVAVEQPTARNWFILGLLVGVTALSRGNVLLLLVTLPLLLWRASPTQGRKRLVGALLLGGILALSPVTVRNLVVARDFTVLTSNGGLYLYIGQKADYGGMFAPVLEEAQADSDHSMEDTLQRELGRELKGSEVSRILTRRARDLFVEDIARMPSHYALKAYRFWSGYELPQIVSYEHWRTRFTALMALPVPYVLLSAFGLLGLFFLPVRARWIVGLLLATWFLSLWPFFPTARYRQPIAPLLAISAAAYLVGLWRRERNLRSPWAMAGMALVFVLWPRWSALPDNEVLWQVHLHEATRAAKLGNIQKTVVKGREAEDAWPGLPETPYRIALYLEEMEAWDDALAALAVAEERAPSNRLIPYRAGRVLEQAGRPEDAVNAFGRAAERDPAWVYPWLRAGLVYNDLGDKAEALKFMERAHQLDPGNRRVRANLASLNAETGNPAEAEGMLEDLVRDYPGYVNGWFNLAVLHLQAGRLDDARRALEGAKVIRGLDANAQEQIRGLEQALVAASPR